MDKKQKIRLRNNLTAAFGAVILVCLWVFAHLTGRTAVSDLQFGISLVLFIGLSAAFVIAVASGVTERFTDPSLTLPQMIWAATTTTVFMSLTTAPAEPYYFLLSIVLIFGVFRMSPREFNIFAAFNVVIVGLHKLSTLERASDTVAVVDVALTWAGFVCCTLILVSLCRSMWALRSRIRERNNRLQEALQVKTRFLANMSHELRTPINAILGAIELMQKTPLDKNQARYADLADANARSLLAILSNMLDISSADAGDIKLQAKDFELQRLLTQVVETHALNACNSGLDLVVDFSKLKPCTVRSDPLRLQQIINNLLENAIKFTPDGYVKLSANIEEIDEQQLRLCCVVEDTGIGIPTEKLDNIFESFAQVDTSSTRAFGGSGLGLAIVRELSDLMSGTVDVCSTVNQGSTFTFVVDLAKGQPRAQDLNSQEEFKAPKDIQALHIIVIHQRDALREALVRQLSAWGAKVTAFSELEKLSECEVVTSARRANLLMVEAEGLAKLGPDVIEFPPGLALAKIPRIAIVNQHRLSENNSALADTELVTPITPDKLRLALMHSQDNFACPSKNDQITSREQSEADSFGTISELANKKVLLVDDNEINREVAGGFLESLDLAYDVAGNGQEAIDKLKPAENNDAYSLVLMDCQMPEMDGYEASRRIRKAEAGEHNRDIIIIALTANAMRGDEEKCREAGMNDFLSKPIDFDSFEYKLIEYLSNKDAPSDKEYDHEPYSKDGSNSSGAHLEALELATPLAGATTDAVSQEIETYGSDKFIWDKAAAVARVRAKRERLIRLINLFIKSMPENLIQLDKAVQERRDADIRRISHGMKGVAANLSAITLANTLEKIEHFDFENSEDTLALLVEKVKQDMEQLQRLLTDYLSE